MCAHLENRKPMLNDALLQITQRCRLSRELRVWSAMFKEPTEHRAVNRRGKLTPYRRPMLTPMVRISTWIARRWPGLQRANQVWVMGLFGFSFESGF